MECVFRGKGIRLAVVTVPGQVRPSLLLRKDGETVSLKLASFLSESHADQFVETITKMFGPMIIDKREDDEEC